MQTRRFQLISAIVNDSLGSNWGWGASLGEYVRFPSAISRLGPSRVSERPLSIHLTMGQASGSLARLDHASEYYRARVFRARLLS